MNAKIEDSSSEPVRLLISASVDNRTVQKILGHKDIRTTLKYGDLFDEHVKDAVEKLTF